MPSALACLLLGLILSACSRPEQRLTREAHRLIEQGKIQQAQEMIETGLRQFPDNPDLRQERMHIHLLSGQAELAAAEARQILQTHPSFQPYRSALRDPSAAVRCSAVRAGLSLNDRQQEILLETAPFALAMAARNRKLRDRMDEPALVYRFPS